MLNKIIKHHPEDNSYSIGDLFFGITKARFGFHIGKSYLQLGKLAIWKYYSI